jgi:stage III sporulation protein AH
MLSKKKKIIMLAGMIILLAVTAYLNFALAANADKNDDDLITTGNFFTNYRSERLTTRSQEISYLDAIINTTQEEYAAQRQEAMDQKLKIITIMDQELAVENILKGKGYEDVVVSIGVTNNTANVIIKTAELTRDDTAIIYNTMLEQTGLTAENIRIIPVE